MSLEPEKIYIGYEYKEISVPNKDVSLFWIAMKTLDGPPRKLVRYNPAKEP